MKKDKVNGFPYLILFLGLIGWAINAGIYVFSKNKHLKLHAAQSCFIALIFVVIGLAFILAIPPLDIATILSYIYPVVYVIFAASVFLGKDIEIGYIRKMVEKK